MRHKFALFALAHGFSGRAKEKRVVVFFATTRKKSCGK